MKVVIIDYGAGNIFSVKQAFLRLGVEAILSNDEAVIRSASHVVFPGVGHAKPAMENLKRSGLDKVIPQLTQPVLGICLGMQLMCGWNEEGNLDGLGIFDSNVYFLNSENLEDQNLRDLKFQNNSILEFYNSKRNLEITDVSKVLLSCPIPHVGWNDVYFENEKDIYYFVHSYAAEICNDTWGISEYPFPFSASLRKDNFWGVQFHPEKSGKHGEEILIDFLELKK